MKGQTQTINSDTLVKLAKYFNVSTDFLTGTTDIPDPVNYDTMELGLSAKAARNLYRGAVNAEVINLLLENSDFAALTKLMADYIHDTYATGYAAQNQVLSVVSNLLMGVGNELPRLSDNMQDAAITIDGIKQPMYQVERAKIQDMFMSILDKIKHTGEDRIEESRQTVQDMMRSMVKTVAKGQDSLVPKVTPDQIVKLIAQTVAITEAPPEALDKFRDGLTALFGSLLPSTNRA